MPPVTLKPQSGGAQLPIRGQAAVNIVPIPPLEFPHPATVTQAFKWAPQSGGRLPGGPPGAIMNGLQTPPSIDPEIYADAPLGVDPRNGIQGTVVGRRAIRGSPKK